MEQWSIHSNVINYVKYNKNPVDYLELDVKALETKNHKRIYKRLEGDDSHVTNLGFGDTPEN